MLSGDVEMNNGARTGEAWSCVAVISGYITFESSPFSAAVADDNTAVYEMFRAHFGLLVQGMRTSPTALIPVLYSKRLISDTDKINLTTLTGVGDIDKATRLLNALETTMKAEPRAAQVVKRFCEAVNDQPALRHVADRITTALGE